MAGTNLKNIIHRRWYSLNVLYFGSDEFSVHSLRALNDLGDAVVGKVQLVTRRPKWCGRSKSILKDVPIVETARALGMPPALTCDSRQDMLGLRELVRKEQFNMIMAVSFGKLIPAELLEDVPYSLNIHPSLLPRYKGASPIQYTLLNKDEYTGVTAQTLDPHNFDSGLIVAQTSPINVRDLLAKGTVSDFDRNSPRRTAILMDQLGLRGASLLKQVINDKLYLRAKAPETSYKPSCAPKITSQMKRVHWRSDSAETALNKLETLGPIYAFKQVDLGMSKTQLKDEGPVKRVILHKVHIVPSLQGKLQPGEFVYDSSTQNLYVQCYEGALQLQELQFEGYKVEKAKQFMASLKKRSGLISSKNLNFV